MPDKRKSSKSYSRVKKYRRLHNTENENVIRDMTLETYECENADVDSVNSHPSAYESPVKSFNSVSEVNEEPIEVLSRQYSSLDELTTDHEEHKIIRIEDRSIESNLPAQTMTQKIRHWALKNMTTLTNKCISDLLVVLRSQGHTELPRRAETLLTTAHVRPTQSMCSKRDTEGSFIYLGIEQAIKKRVNDKVYNSTTIKILVNTDGMPLFRSSRKQFWPILIQVFDENYDCAPAIVALYYGDSKPASIGEFLHEFVEEAILLINNGIVIGSTHYMFKIEAFVCDTPARAFIKCCKAHTGFYGCERCETKGLTSRKKNRVYPEMDAALRTHETFKNQNQPAHHHQNEMSPLLQLPNFDIISGVVLDYMHLLCIGVMRSLFEKWFGEGKKGKGKSIARVKRTERKILREIMQVITSSVPCEFQRKELDLEDWVHWKATQFRFFLFYCGGIVLRNVLSPDRYKHFLLLFVASRILNDSETATQYTAYAKNLLRKFFFLMPTYYGSESQTMNFHNLIHIADDVEYMKTPLSSFSAFPFENELGTIKKLIRAPRNPLVQVVNRLSELDALPDYIIRPRNDIGSIKFARGSAESPLTIQKIDIKKVVLSSSRPNNLALLNDGSVIRITQISTMKRVDIQVHDLLIQGYLMNVKGDAFKYPQNSSAFGIFKLGKRQNTVVERSGSDFAKKCVFLPVGKKSTP